MLPEPAKAIKIFFSYAHRDKKFRSELEKHLIILNRHGYINTWHDGKINAGKEWENEILTHLNNADIVLLLISPDFMASDYCDSVEVTTALKRQEAGECQVIPIILRPVSWKIARFSKLQALPSGAKPISTWSNKDQAYFDIEEGLIKVIEEISKNSQQEAAQVLPTYPQVQPPNLGTVVLSSLAEPIEAEPPNFYIDQTSAFSDQHNSTILPQTMPKLERIQPTINTKQYLTLQDIKGKWEYIKRRIKTKKDGAKIAAFLNGYTLLALDHMDNTPMLLIQANASLYYQALQKIPECHSIIEWGLTVELGQECRVRLLPPNQGKMIAEVELQMTDQYSITELLRISSTSIFYRGKLRKKDILIKRLTTPLPTTADKEAFLTRARQFKKLKNRNIINTTDANVDGNYGYLVMEYLEGETLRQRIAPGTQITPNVARLYLSHVAGALHYAHVSSVLHSNLHPGNLIYGPYSTVIVTEFALMQPELDDETAAIPYMAPEQLRGQPTSASDQYALAVMVYEWLSGRRPYEATERELLLEQQAKDPYPPLHDLNPAVSPAIASVMGRALSYDPAERYPHIQDFSDHYLSALAGFPIRPTTPIGERSGSLIAPLTLQDIKGKWEYIKRRIRTKKDGAKVAAFLNGYTVFALEHIDNTPILLIKANAQYHYESLQKKPEYRAIIEWGLTAELNQECRVRLLSPYTDEIPPPFFQETNQ